MRTRPRPKRRRKGVDSRKKLIEPVQDGTNGYVTKPVHAGRLVSKRKTEFE